MLQKQIAIEIFAALHRIIIKTFKGAFESSRLLYQLLFKGSEIGLASI